ncbi:hypothetical protein [Streptomyces sp. NPDC050759]|uniref:hypothetical protein n=1 Tax=Streptomyces sp. NPDC050759 TaxID=3365635 RepID=UPI0037B8893B
MHGGIALATELVREGTVSEDLVDRAVRRVLRQKIELGLLDADFNPDSTADGPIDLDPPAHRAVARELAEQCIALLGNRDGRLPLAPDTGSITLIGPCADDARRRAPTGAARTGRTTPVLHQPVEARIRQRASARPRSRGLR